MDKSLDAISFPLLSMQEKDFGRSKKKSTKEFLRQSENTSKDELAKIRGD
jgi:hypothetical protein